MKTSAPEKIYLNPLLMEDGESIVRRCTFERQRDSQIEYTRTDAFIEPVSEELEEEIQKHLKECLNVKFPTTDIESIKKDVEYTARRFANWQKQQMMKQAIEVQVNPLLGETFVGCKVSGYEVGEKVKIIIIKEGEKC